MTILPVTRLPGGMPNSSPMAARTAGAVWTTTCFVGSSIASQISGGGVVALERAGGAAVDALAAVDADRVGQVVAQARARSSMSQPRPAACSAADALDVVAGPHAAPAEDALVGVADDRQAGCVDLVVLALALEPHFLDAKLLRQLLKLALLVLGAGEALLRMVREQQLDDHPARLAHLGRVRLDFHSLGDRVGAGRAERALALDLDRADRGRRRRR